VQAIPEKLDPPELIQAGHAANYSWRPQAAGGDSRAGWPINSL
jgi:hypothetical protein